MRLVVSALIVIHILQPDTLDSQFHSPRNFNDFNYSLIYILFFHSIHSVILVVHSLATIKVSTSHGDKKATSRGFQFGK
jgi:hypothetical protein